MLKRFFLLCSGADKDLIQQCSNGEQNKQAGIGATVFFTAVMAFLAGSFALFTVFDSPYFAVFFGAIWGLLIFNLDRFIVSTIKKRDTLKKEIAQALPRIILAVLIAIVISKPLEIKIFDKEIQSILLQEKNQLTLQNKKEMTNYFQMDLEQNQAMIDSLKAEIKTKEKEVNQLYSTYITEAEGTAGSKRLGKGPVYKEKRQKHDAALQELQSLKTFNQNKIAEIEQKIINIQSDLDKKIETTQPIIDNFDGLMARINALNKLPWLPSFFIMLLFLAIETSPILVKILAPKSEYDFRQENSELALHQILQQNNYLSQLQTTTDKVIYDKVYAELQEDKEPYQYKKEKALLLLQLQADRFLEKQKKHNL